MDKPPFDPSQPFQAVGGDKPAFDPSQPFEEAGPSANVSQGESALRGAGQGATLGFQDEGSGALEAGLGAAQSLATGSNPFGDQGRTAGLRNLLENYRRARDTQRQQNDSAQAANPKTFLAGNLAGGIPLAMATGGTINPEASAVGKIAQATRAGAGVGAIQGLGGSSADITQGNGANAVEDTLKGAAIGGVTGGALEGGGMALGRGINSFGSAAEEAANNSRVAALGGGKAATKKLLLKDQVQDLGSQLRQDKIIGPFTSRNAIEERLGDALETHGDQIGQAVEAADTVHGAAGFIPASSIVEQARDSILRPLLKTGLTDSEAGNISKLIDSFESQHQGQYLSIKQLQDFKKILQAKTGVFEKAGDTPMADAYKALYGLFNKNAEAGIESAAVNNPGLESVQNFQEAKKAYGLSKTAQSMVADKNARTATNRFISPTDYVSSAAGVIGGAVVGGPIGAAIGLGLGAVNHFGREYGNQISANVFQGVSNILKSNPSSLGKYAQPLMSAAQRGAPALAASHFVLMQSDPKYREMIEGTDQNGEP